MYQKRKIHKKFSSNLVLNRSVLQFGFYGLKSCKFKKLTLVKAKYLQFLLEKFFKKIIISKRTKVWNRIVMNSTLTKLSSESRMGKGKGHIDTYFTYIKPGQILFEVEKIDIKDWKQISIKIHKQFGFAVKIICRN